PGLQTLYERGTANGVEGLEMIGPERLRELEPHARAVRALYSPNTAIVDYGAVTQALAARLERHGVQLLTGSRLHAIERTEALLAFALDGYRLRDVNLGETLGALAYPGFWAMARPYWRTGMYEFYRSLSKPAFLHALQRLVPELSAADLRPGGSGVRAQAVG